MFGVGKVGMDVVEMERVVGWMELLLWMMDERECWTKAGGSC